LPENDREVLKLAGIKGGCEEVEHEFLFGIFRPEKKKQDYLFRCSVAPGNFPLERPKKSCVPFTFQLDFPAGIIF